MSMFNSITKWSNYSFIYSFIHIFTKIGFHYQLYTSVEGLSHNGPDLALVVLLSKMSSSALTWFLGVVPVPKPVAAPP